MPSTAGGPHSAAQQVRLPIVAAGVCWLAAIVAGFTAATLYEQTPAAVHASAEFWPTETRCQPPAGKPLLVMFIHPKCPCTRSSLEEVSQLQRRCGDLLDLQFVFLQPADASWRTEETAHWRTARALNAGSSLIDAEGVEHRRFGATTSGEAFLYAADGRLAFRGGMSIGRGHSGESPGRLAIESLVSRGTASTPSTPVYGCSLDRAAGNCSPLEATTRK